MPEYSVELPIWNYDWDDLGLSNELLDRLADWQARFDASFDPTKGWRSVDDRDAWAHEGDGLIEQLRSELPQGADLEVDLWPLRDEA